MSNDASGTVAYAGLDAGELIARAWATFAQPQNAPGRFRAFLPLFPAELIVNMNYPAAGKPRDTRVAPNGFSIDPTEYHRVLSERLPTLYAGDNRLRNFTYEGRYLGHGVFTVDGAWAEMFPQYALFLGDQLCVYLVGGGGQAVAVPESVYPRGGAMLTALETALLVTRRGEAYARYVRARVAGGEPYDAAVFGADYLRSANLAPLSFAQAELERVLQEMAVARSQPGDTETVGSFTVNARLAARVNQYQPMRYACDTFRGMSADERPSRLVQPGFQEEDFIGDLWIPYREFVEYVEFRAKTLDVRKLCEGFQIAPRYDPVTGGGRYPDTLYVAEVCDRAIAFLAAATRNNPAYGSGTGAQGAAGTVVYVEDSREMIRQRKLTLEKAALSLANRLVPPREYSRMLALAILQEHKGRLIDALYRRETAYRNDTRETPAWQKTEKLLSVQAERLTELVRRESALCGEVSASGYDEDLETLRLMALERETGGDGATAPGARLRDEEREASIEAGYIMRTGIARMPYAQAALVNVGGTVPVANEESEETDDSPAIGDTATPAFNKTAGAAATTVGESAGTQIPALTEKPTVNREPQLPEEAPAAEVPTATGESVETQEPSITPEPPASEKQPTAQEALATKEPSATKEHITTGAECAAKESPITTDTDEADEPFSPEESSSPAQSIPGIPPLVGAPRRSLTLRELVQRAPPPAARSGVHSMADLLQKKGG